jgi:WD40 repeat protein
VDRAVRYIFGRDFFISYARRDAAAYAAALATELGTTHSCYLDQLATPRGAELPAPIRKEVSRATTFVLVGSPAAVESHYVGDEIERFLQTGRPVLLLDIDSALALAPWTVAPWSQLTGVFRQSESGEALRTGRPSAATVAYVRGSFAFTKHDQRLRRASMAAAGLLAVAVGGGAIVSGVATQRAADAGRRADAARVDEAKARTRADAESQRASDAGKRAADATEQEKAARQRADEQERIATSRRLANESTSQIDGDPELALVLAAHSLDIADTVEARRALLSGLSHYPGLSRIVRAPTATEPGTFSMSADGRVFATGDDQAVEIWNVDPFRRRARIRNSGGDLHALALTPDGSVVAIGRRGAVLIADSATGRELGRLGDTESGALAFIDANRLAAGVGDQVQLWDVADRSHPVSKGALLSVDNEVEVIVVEPGGRTLAVSTLYNIITCNLTTSCAATAEPLTSEGDSTGYWNLAFAPRSEIPMLATTTLAGRLAIWELQSRRRVVDLSTVNDLNLVAGPRRDGRDLFDVALGPGAELAVVGSAQGGLIVQRVDDLMNLSNLIQLGAQSPDIRNQEELFQVGAAPGMRSAGRKVTYVPGASHVGVSEDGHIVVAQSDGGVSLWDSSGRAAFEFARPWKDGHEAGAPDAASADGRHVVDVGRGGKVRLWDAPSDGAPTTLSFPSAMKLAVSADADLVAAVDSGGTPSSWRTLAVWDSRGRTRLKVQIDRRVAPAVQPRTYPTQVLVSGPPDDHIVGVVLADGTAAAWSVDARSARLLVARSGVQRIAASASRGEIAFAGRDGVVSLWNAADARATRLPGTVPDLAALWYSSDGGALAGVTARPGRESGVFERWELKTPGDPSVWNVPGSALHVLPLAVTGDLAALAVAQGPAVEIWDTTAQALVLSHRFPDNVESLAFARDGGLLVGHAGGVSYLDLSPAHLVNAVCAFTSRTLTPEESQRYLGARAAAPRCGRE